MTLAEAEQAKGPLVWLDMDQAALDRAYDQTIWAPNQSLTAERRAAAATEAKARLKSSRHAYGDSEIEAFDFYACGVAEAPIVIFIHGGAWRNGMAENFAHLADTFTNAGAHIAILDFTNIDDAGGRLESMVEQVRRATAFIAKKARELGGDGRIFVCGHSSGSHLSSCVLTTDWAEYDLPQNIISGAILMSGMYELEPVRRSKRSTYVRFTDETVEALSALRRMDRIVCPVIVTHGTCESPEFQRQGRDFAEALRKAGKQVTYFSVAGANHFEMMEQLHNPYGFVGRAALAMIAGR
ncbi:MAG: alpha/beta hydrolase [Beijerinckiaceae bacterium]|nr:alpha/beta hydrolase [Beijerinckiaceae bacterium]